MTRGRSEHLGDSRIDPSPQLQNCSPIKWQFSIPPSLQLLAATIPPSASVNFLYRCHLCGFTQHSSLGLSISLSILPSECMQLVGRVEFSFACIPHCVCALDCGPGLLSPSSYYDQCCCRHRVQTPAWTMLLVAVGIDSEAEARTPCSFYVYLFEAFSQGLQHFMFLPAVTNSSCFFRSLTALTSCCLSYNDERNVL